MLFLGDSVRAVTSTRKHSVRLLARAAGRFCWMGVRSRWWSVFIRSRTTECSRRSQ